MNSFCFTSIVPSDGLFYNSMEPERIQPVKVTNPPVVLSDPTPCPGEVSAPTLTSTEIKEIVDNDSPNMYAVHSALTGVLYYA